MTEAEWIAFLQRPEIPAFSRVMLVNPDDDLPRLGEAIRVQWRRLTDDGGAIR